MIVCTHNGGQHIVCPKDIVFISKKLSCKSPWPFLPISPPWSTATCWFLLEMPDRIIRVWQEQILKWPKGHFVIIFSSLWKTFIKNRIFFENLEKKLTYKIVYLTSFKNPRLLNRIVSTVTGYFMAMKEICKVVIRGSKNLQRVLWTTASCKQGKLYLSCNPVLPHPHAETSLRNSWVCTRACVRVCARACLCRGQMDVRVKMSSSVDSAWARVPHWT